jgi:mRNA interferase RelE/StbE
LAWTIEWDIKSQKEFNKLDRSIQRKILNFLLNKISPLENPRVFGKSLSYEKFGLWRYRVEDFRIICRIDDASIKIIVVRVGHRKEVYDE